MKVLFTGATGVLGRVSVPLLVSDGHEVTAVSRSEGDAAWLDAIGARPAHVDLFDQDSIRSAIGGMDTVIHFATSIPPQAAMTKRASWTMNDRLRRDATKLLVDAALAGSVERFIQQSVTLVYADGGEGWLDEHARVEPVWEVLGSAIEAESQVAGFQEHGGTGIVLRLSRLYGPGKASAELISAAKARQLPVVGKGDNYVSSIHSHDAANALRASLSVPGGTYNVTDDEPVTAAAYAHVLAEAVGAAKPRRVPTVFAKLAMRESAGLVTISHRVNNKKFKEVAGWEPKFTSVRQGWADIVGQGRSESAHG